MLENNYLDFGTFRAGVAPKSEQAELETWVDLFAPADQRLPSLKPIQQPEEFEIAVAGQPKTSEMAGIQRRRYSVRIKARPGIPRSWSGGSFAKTVTLRSDDGSSALATVIWRQVERYSVAPSAAHFGTVEADGSSKEARVLVSTSMEQPIVIGSIMSDSNYLVVEQTDPAPAGPHGKHQVLRLVLTVPEGVDQEALSGTVLVEMADEGATAVPIRWSAFVRHRAMASESPGAPTGAGKDEVR